MIYLKYILLLKSSLVESRVGVNIIILLRTRKGFHFQMTSQIPIEDQKLDLDNTITDYRELKFPFLYAIEFFDL
jgi:hypothetical protein